MVSSHPLPDAAVAHVDRSSPKQKDQLALLRRLFQSGEIAAALAQAQMASAGDPENCQLRTLLGDLLFRQARFAEAEQIYKSVVQQDPTHARAHWGLGRLAGIRSRTAEARDYFAAAYQLDPRDPEVVLSYAEQLTDPDQRTALLREFLNLAGRLPLEQREEIAAELEIAKRLAGRKAARLVSPYQAYRLKASGFAYAEDSPAGLQIQVRINGRTLRLLLDSGAEGLFLNRRIAEKLNLETLLEARVRGLGTGSAGSAQLALAHTVSVDQLHLEDCFITVMDLGWLPEVDGVIGTDIFKDFLVRIHSQDKLVELTPYAETTGGSRSDGATTAFRVGPYLLVQGSSNLLPPSSTPGSPNSGYFMVDTGASFTVITSRSLAAPLPSSQQLRGAQGGLRGTATLVPLHLSIANQKWTERNPVAVDLTHMSQQAGVEISGILGFPLLRQSILTINYRDGLVEFTAVR